MSCGNKQSLPDGWSRKEIKRKIGNRTDVYIYSPSGTVFRSKTTLLNYIEARKLPFKIEDFNFNTQKRNTNKRESISKTPSPGKMESSGNNITSPDKLSETQGSCSVDAESFSEQTDEDITNNVMDMSQNLLKISESCFQLQYEKERTEKTLLKLEEEANYTISKLQEEIKILKIDNDNLKEKAKNQEEEIQYLKESIAISKKNENHSQNCKKCDSLMQEVVNLNEKIANLRKENLNLMNTILPCPSPDTKLLAKNKQLENRIRELEKETNDILTNQNEIINVLTMDMEVLNSENLKLRSENIIYKKQTDEMTEEKSVLAQYDQSLIQRSRNRPNSVNEDVINKAPRQLNTIINKGNSKKILILADSHGRQLASNLKSFWPNNEYNISTIFKPNAIMSEVVKDLKDLTKSFSKTDTLVVIGNSNDEIGQAERMFPGLFEKLLNDTKHTNVIISSLPYRHHAPGLSDKITYLNLDLEQIVLKHEHASILPINELHRRYYTRHGLHFNRQGKWKIAAMLKEIIQSKYFPRTQDIKTFFNLPVDQEISVIETNMRDIIKQYSSDSSVAFSHTISSDFDDKRHMTTGVAVIFRQQFGRPKTSECVDERLTYQRLPGGASVYGLITKAKYYGKPTEEEYNAAFKTFIEDFKEKKLKTLFCSPMGCIRDLITPELFMKNIVEFQQSTQAKVVIVSYDEQSYRKLRNGLSHRDFMKTLHSLIQQHRPTNQAKDPNPLSLEAYPMLPLPNTEKPMSAGISSTVPSSGGVSYAEVIVAEADRPILAEMPLHTQESRDNNSMSTLRPKLQTPDISSGVSAYQECSEVKVQKQSTVKVNNLEKVEIQIENNVALRLN